VARERTRRSKDYQTPAPASAAGRARERRQQVRPVTETKTQTGQKKEQQGGARRFVAECVGELRKVDWPGQRQLVSATVVVLIAIFVVGLYLYVADEALSRLVRDVLLR
jgi:preprotein translocase subunit SecE